MWIRTARDAADRLGPIFRSADREMIGVAHLDEGQRLIDVAEFPPGCEDKVALPVRAILTQALLHGASGIIVAHNHPSGDPRPSAADIKATRKLAETARTLGIRLHDHLIFTNDDCSSFRQLGLL